MKWEREEESGYLVGHIGAYCIGDYGSALNPYVLTFARPAKEGIELGRYINLAAAKEAAQTHAGVTA